MSFGTERFITEVQNRPCIWNILSEEYSNRVLKQSAWNEIAEILYADWQNLEESNKRKRSKFHCIYYFCNIPFYKPHAHR